MKIWNFISEQVIGLKWLNELIGNILRWIGIDTENRIGESLNFFFYETIKIAVLLLIIVFVISFVQSYFPPERTKKILSKYKGIKGNIIGAMLGILSPFCSCSSIPLFVGLNKAGVPLGVSFSFLICSPLVDMASLIFLMGIFGVKIGTAYVVVGVILAILGGLIIEKLNLGKEINLKEEKTVSSCCDSSKKEELVPLFGGEGVQESCCSTEGENDGCCLSSGEEILTIRDRISYSKVETVKVISGIWKYIFISIGIGTLIHSWIPQEAILRVLGENNPFSVIIATGVGVPLYTDEMSAIVIGNAFYNQGVQLGTILSFMMSAAALSIPSMIMLRSVMSKKLLAIFVGIVTIGIVIVGYLFNIMHVLF